MHAWKDPEDSRHPRDAVRTWAELEGKSPQMSDDLYRHHRWRRRLSARWRLALRVVLRVASTAAESWWHISRR